MTTEFQKAIKPTKKPSDIGDKTFQISFRCIETRQHFEISTIASIGAIYKNSSAFRLHLLDRFDKLIQKYLEGLPVER